MYKPAMPYKKTARIAADILAVEKRREEDEADLAVLRERLADGSTPVPWEQVKAEMGL